MISFVIMRDLLLTAFLIAVWALFLESAQRLIDPQAPMYIYVHDGLRGWAFPPGAHGWAFTDDPTYVRFNREGFNDREHSVARKPGIVRIAVLGDSMTAETMVPKPDIFTSVLERNLPSTEVLNFGINAYNIEQCRRLLNSVVWKYDPQVLVLFLTFQSGIAYNVRELGYSDDSTAPYITLEKGRLAPDAATARMKEFKPQRTALENTYAYLANESRLFLLFNTAYLRVHHVFESRHAAPRKQDKPLDWGLRSYQPDSSPEMTRAWTVAEALLVAMRDEVQSHGAKFVVAVPGSQGQTLPSLIAREKFKSRLGVPSLYLSNQKLASFCKRENITLIDLTEPMAKYALEHKVSLYGFGSDLHGNHWNRQGNLIGGESLAKSLAPIIRHESFGLGRAPR